MRPAIIVSSMTLGGAANLCWAVMVTSAVNRGWPDDISLEERFEECGLHVPCVIRTAKIASLEVARAERIGRLPEDLVAAVRLRLATHIGL